LALIDYQMPLMDGLELARAIRALPAGAELPMVLLTSVTLLSGQDIKASGFAAYLPKPLKQSVLLQTLSELSGPRRASDPQAPLPVLEDAASADAGGQRLLLVEDNPVNRRLVTLMLVRAGYQVDVAVDGRAAVQAAAASTYDAILMDAQMPEMDGYKATLAIRAAEKPGERVPVIALTARAMEGDREKCLAAGMDDYLTKPITQVQLLKVVHRWARRGTREAGSSKA
jgi:CheY-like chemotaxis protein